MNDMHIHLRNGIENIDIFNEYVLKCIELNLKKVVFLEHGNRISTKHSGILNSKENIDKFNTLINNYNYNKKEHIKILRGIEIDYSKDINFKKNTLNLINYGKFDWVIGSIHSMKFETLGQYLDSVIDMINNYNINVIGHLKLDNTYKNYEKKILKILKICFEKNIFIEINTSDRSRWNDEQLYYMLKLINDYNINYVLGSDAHEINEIGYMINETTEKIEKWKIKK